MRGGDKEPEEKDYFYTRCSNCGIKLHYTAYTCWKCGKKPLNLIIHSKKPENAIYCANYCEPDRCIHCWKVRNSGKPCEPIHCFGTGRGKCDLCKQYSDMRFECCQKEQNGEPIIKTNTPAEKPDEIEIPF